MADRIVVVGATARLAQVEDFPEGCARSCKGALHLRPGSTKVLTEGELSHLQAKHPEVVAGLRVVDTTPPKAKLAPKAKPVPPVIAEVVAKAEERSAAATPAEDATVGRRGRGRAGSTTPNE